MPFPAITTIDQSNPQLASYGGLTVSPELAAQLAQLQQNGAMVGQDPFNGVPVPQEGESLLGFLANLHFAGQTQMASDLAQMNGIPQQDFTSLIQTVNDATTRPNTTGNFLGTLADAYSHNPLLMAATGLAAAGLSSPAAAGAGGAGGAATTYPLTTGPLAAGAGTVAITPIAAGAGGAVAGAAGGGGAAAGAGGGLSTVNGGDVPIGDANSLGDSWRDLIDTATGNRSIPDWVANYLLPGINAALGTNAANQASDAMVGAADRAIAENARQYDTTRADLAPWMTAGRNALGRLENPAASFTASPGYEFTRSEGLRGIENLASAKGTLKSGNALRALDQFNSGLASQDFGNWVNQQLSLAGLGQTTATDLGRFGASNAGTVGNYLSAAGDARASGVLGRTNQIQNGLYDVFDNARYRNSLSRLGL